MLGMTQCNSACKHRLSMGGQLDVLPISTDSKFCIDHTRLIQGSSNQQ